MNAFWTGVAGFAIGYVCFSGGWRLYRMMRRDQEAAWEEASEATLRSAYQRGLHEGYQNGVRTGAELARKILRNQAALTELAQKRFLVGSGHAND